MGFFRSGCQNAGIEVPSLSGTERTETHFRIGVIKTIDFVPGTRPTGVQQLDEIYGTTQPPVVPMLSPSKLGQEAPMLSEHSQHEQSGEGTTGSGDKKDGEQEDQEATEPGKKEGAVDEKPLTSEEVLDPTLSPGSHQEIDAF